ncbi:putative tetrahydrofolylpolyglutamate synthase [Exophiala viscosa]|uniref:putative tetrahydrofolylpolyglutamate synthase n=1 Tax=Exophiala viscosa TaxID=2486360 RepID=UPI00219B9E99|nr:putative tetrahydrofolylpolyglutamate synthase [Exophiala viscosa]
MEKATRVCSKRTYENALKLLETRRRKARPKTSHATNTTSTSATANQSSVKAGSSLRGTPSLMGMKDWLRKIGYTDRDIAALNIVHVAGTKGKGSTCAFVRSLLQQYGKRTGFPKKVGLYTSPDLTCIRERIQINGTPISEDLFTKYFYDIWDRLFVRHAEDENLPQPQPRYLQFLLLLAIHTFVKEGAQATIIETHHGGEYDATNIVPAPVVTGITSIGLDHLAQLGPTIQDVAWHKAGIFKSGSLAFSAPQDPEVEAVLRSRADEKDVQLEIVGVDQSVPRDANALRAPVQRINCSLAIALVSAFLSRKSPSDEKALRREDIENGIEHFSWPGRFEVIKTPNCTWYLDGAHNELSIGQAVQWFAEMTRYTAEGSSSMVIFSHVSEERDGPSLLRALARALEHSGVRGPEMVFTTYQERRDGMVRLDKTLKPPEDESLKELPKQYCDMWKLMHSDARTRFEPSIEEALEYADRVGSERGGKLQVLVTGSLHLVGGALYLLHQEQADGL